MTRTSDNCFVRLLSVEMSILIRIVFVAVLILPYSRLSQAMSRSEKDELKNKVSEMFLHAYRNYMDHAYPADELMPLSCKGRYRGTPPLRGDIDDALGNFSLTLIDTLDTLVVLGEFDEFERAVRHVIEDISFDNDIVVSVFETNIRVVGGLLGGHLMASLLKQKKQRMLWYDGELLKMAQELGDRLLPAFNTSTGMPYPRVNLRYGVKHEMSRTGSEKDTCTACAGTMLLEFSALSRLTGNNIYEKKATRAMDYLWESRHRASNLVGTVINIHNGDWVRRDSGVGAGIDSYYEYLLKGYIMLGKDTYLERFNKHYTAVMKYISNGPLMLDVHMHRPQMNSRNFMDALLAFWPGLQVLKGDLKSAIEIHEMLYQVTLRHNFLPEAFTKDFRVHWAQHPLRPEFLESTYFLYRATSDPYYLEVGKSVMENLDRHARVPCGFAAIKDVTTGIHEDQMDSYFLAETFKYLYLLFSKKEDLILNVDDYVFTTEAHLLPLFLSLPSSLHNFTEDSETFREDRYDDEYDFHNTCPSTNHLFKGKADFAHHLRSPLKNMVENLCPKPKTSDAQRLKASEFIAGNKDQVALLNRMGIRIITMSDGRVQLLHLSNEAASPEDSEDGLVFMQEMVELSKAQSSEAPIESRVVQLMSPPYFGSVILKAGPAQFGVSLKNHPGIDGQLSIADPIRGCQPLSNSEEVQGKFVMVERGDCMFVDKARHLQNAGAVGGIIFDNNSQSDADSSPIFSMSGDGMSDVIIPLVFLFRSEASTLQEALTEHPNLVVYVSERNKNPEDILLQYLSYQSRSLTLESQESSGTDDASHSQSTMSAAFSTLPNADAKTESDVEAGVNDLILLLLRKINLEQLQPFIRTRTREKLDAGIIGSFPLRVIRMPDESEDTIQMKTGNNEEAQHVVRVVFTEFLMLLLECTNLKQLKNLDQIVDAFARLTENVFTSGRMGFGVHTETLINEIKDQLIAKKTCSLTSFPSVPNAVADEDGTGEVSVGENGYSVLQDSIQMKASLSGDYAEDVESQELKEMVGKFVEDQLGMLVKELLVASMQKSFTSSVEVVIASDTPMQESSCEAGEESLCPVDNQLQDENHLDGIKHQLNSVLDGNSVTVVQMPSDAGNDDVKSVCDPDTIVDDVDKIMISDSTGEPVWQDSHGVLWKHENGCWQKSSAEQVASNENAAPDEITLNEVSNLQSYTPQSTSGGILREDSSENSDLVEAEKQDKKHETMKSRLLSTVEKLVTEYKAEILTLEQDLKSSDDREEQINFDSNFHHLGDDITDLEDGEISSRNEFAAAEEEHVKLLEPRLEKMDTKMDYVLDSKNTHISDLPLDDGNDLLSRVPSSHTLDDYADSLNSEIQVSEKKSVMQSTSDDAEDLNSELPVRSSHDVAHRHSSDQELVSDSLHIPAQPAMDRSQNLKSSDFDSNNPEFADNTDVASADAKLTKDGLRTRN